LSEWGFGRGDVIAGMIPPRSEMAVALATLPAASTFAPLGPAFSEDLYAELLMRLRAKAVIVPAELEHPVRAAAKRCGLAEIADGQMHA
jgi:oxalate---CoA ligase